MAKQFCRIICLSLALGMMVSCVPKYTWKATPVIQQADNEYYSVQLEPIGRCEEIYNGFMLTVVNKSSQDMEIDWNKTLYLHNGQTNGGFMFEGVIYKDRNNQKPPDIVFANSTFKKAIWPNSLASFGGYKPQWGNGPLRAGENGVYLTMRMNGQEVHEKLTMNIRIAQQ